MSVAFQTPPRRILVRGVNWLGDAVMTTPALLRLREKFPGAHLALLCPEKLKDLWRHHPAVDEIIPFAADESVFVIGKKLRRWGERPREPLFACHPASTARGGSLASGGGADGAGVRCSSPHLEVHGEGAASSGKFDLALVLPNSPRSALEVFLAGIPRRIGYARPWRNFFLTQAVASRPGAVKMRKRSVDEIKSLMADHSKLKTQNSKPAPAAHQIHEYLNLAAAQRGDVTRDG